MPPPLRRGLPRAPSRRKRARWAAGNALAARRGSSSMAARQLSCVTRTSWPRASSGATCGPAAERDTRAPRRPRRSARCESVNCMPRAAGRRRDRRARTTPRQLIHGCSGWASMSCSSGNAASAASVSGVRPPPNKAGSRPGTAPRRTRARHAARGRAPGAKRIARSMSSRLKSASERLVRSTTSIRGARSRKRCEARQQPAVRERRRASSASARRRVRCARRRAVDSPSSVEAGRESSGR